MDERRALVRHCKSCDMDIELCYQTFGAASDPAVILVGGLNMQSYAWDEGFCDALVNRGFYVIRFDNRDIGHSTKIEAPAQSTASSGGGEFPHASSVPQSSASLHLSTADGNGVTQDATILAGEANVTGGSLSCVVRIPPAPPQPHAAGSFQHSNRQYVHHHQQQQQQHQRLMSQMASEPYGSLPGKDGSSCGRCPLWCTKETGLECVYECVHFLKKKVSASLRCCLSRCGVGVLRSPTLPPNGSACTIPRARRIPKIVPWKLLLPQSLSCGEVLPYTLEDMALDALALLDVLGVQRAHVFGISMGGMISQHMALLAPHRVLTLTCIMSSTNAQDLPHPAWWVKLWMLRKPASNINRDQLVEFRMRALQGLLYGCVPVDEDYLKKRIAMSLNRSSYGDGLLRQAAAIMRAPSRDEELSRVVRCPCLILHGQNDVLCRVEHGYRLAKVLTNSKFVVFKNMGHYLNPAYFDAIVTEFLGLVQRGKIFESEEHEREAQHLSRLNRVSTRYEAIV